MVHRKKVMWLIKGLGAGGAEKLLSTAIPYLNHADFEYEVAYMLPEKNDLVRDFQQAEIPVFCLGRTKPYDLAVIFRLARLLRERKVDILHIHLPLAGILGRFAALLGGVRTVVYTEHNLQEMYHPVTRFLNRVTYPLDAATITVSDEVQRSSLKWKRLQPKMVRTIPGGVDIAAIDAGIRGADLERIKASMGIPQGHHVVGNVAHIRPEKGQEYLLEAAAKVVQRRPDTTFVIVGREKAAGALKKLEVRAAELGIQDRIIFAGFQENVIALVKTFDVFVLSSLYEGLPIALLEAMTAGVAPVVTAVGGIPEVIKNGVNGLLVEPKDPDSLADGIGTLLSDPVSRKAMALEAAKTARERFSVQRMVEDIESVYLAAMASDASRPVEVA